MIVYTGEHSEAVSHLKGPVLKSLLLDAETADAMGFQSMIAAAVDHFLSVGVPVPVPVPPAIERAICLMVAHFITAPDLLGGEGYFPAIPRPVERLIAPYREIAL